MGRVPGPVGDEHPVQLLVPEERQRSVVRHLDHAEPAAQLVDDAGLDPAVDQRHLPIALVLIPHDLRGGYLGHEVPFRRVLHAADLGQHLVGVLVEGDGASQNALLADADDQGPGVQLGDARHLLLEEVLVEGLPAVHGGHVPAELPDRVAGHLNPRGFLEPIADAVVADDWVGHDKYLASVGRVGQALLVAGHARIEHDLAVNGLLITKASALSYCPVFEDEVALLHQKVAVFVFFT